MTLKNNFTVLSETTNTFVNYNVAKYNLWNLIITQLINLAESLILCENISATTAPHFMPTGPVRACLVKYKITQGLLFSGNIPMYYGLEWTIMVKDFIPKILQLKDSDFFLIFFFFLEIFLLFLSSLL